MQPEDVTIVGGAWALFDYAISMVQPGSRPDAYRKLASDSVR